MIGAYYEHHLSYVFKNEMYLIKREWAGEEGGGEKRMKCIKNSFCFHLAPPYIFLEFICFSMSLFFGTGYECLQRCCLASCSPSTTAILKSSSLVKRFTIQSCFHGFVQAVPLPRMPFCLCLVNSFKTVTSSRNLFSDSSGGVMHTLLWPG